MSKDTRTHYPGKELEAMSFATRYHRWIINEFEPYLGETVAEVGAGIGSVSQLLLDKRIKRLFAFEPSHNMYPLLEKAFLLFSVIFNTPQPIATSGSSLVSQWATSR